MSFVFLGPQLIQEGTISKGSLLLKDFVAHSKVKNEANISWMRIGLDSNTCGGTLKQSFRWRKGSFEAFFGEALEVLNLSTSCKLTLEVREGFERRLSPCFFAGATNYTMQEVKYGIRNIKWVDVEKTESFQENHYFSEVRWEALLFTRGSAIILQRLEVSGTFERTQISLSRRIAAFPLAFAYHL